MPVFTDYNLQNNFSPFVAAAQGMRWGQEIQANARALESQDAQQQYEQQFRNDIAALGQSRASAQDYFGLLTKYPDKAQFLTQQYERLDSAQRENMLKTVMPIYTAAYNGQHGLAAQQAEQRAQAAERSGDMESAQSFRQSAHMLKTMPEVAVGGMGATLARAMGPERFKSVLEALNAPAAAADRGLDAGTKMVDYERKLFELQQSRQEAPNKSEANRLDIEIKRFQAENAPMATELGNQKTFEDIRRARADASSAELDAQGKRRTAGMPVIPPQLQSKVVDWQLSAETNRKAAQQARSLSQTFRTIGTPGGAFSTVGDWFDRATGNDTPEARARMELERFVNSEVVKSLPPGPATDRDIDLVRRGFPTRTSDSKVIAEFLDASARLGDLAAKTEQARAEWAETFGTLGKARTSGEVGGVQIMPGTSFNDFMSMQARAPMRQQGAQATAGGWSQRRYMQR
jgi:hypothetical protein